MRFNVLRIDARQQVVALDLEAANETLAADQARASGPDACARSSAKRLSRCDCPAQAAALPVDAVLDGAGRRCSTPA